MKKPWTKIWLVLALAALLVAGWQIASNRKQVATIKQEIAASDQTGQDTATKLVELKNFVANHMATSTAVELTAAYNRAVAAASASSNGAVYGAAQAACASHADSITQANCVAAYLASHSTPGGEVAALPDRAQYQYSYKSPAVTPDLTGSLLLVAVAAAGLALFSRALRNPNG